jgi:hypothetical protein
MAYRRLGLVRDGIRFFLLNGLYRVRLGLVRFFVECQIEWPIED